VVYCFYYFNLIDSVYKCRLILNEIFKFFYVKETRRRCLWPWRCFFCFSSCCCCCCYDIIFYKYILCFINSFVPCIHSRYFISFVSVRM